MAMPRAAWKGHLKLALISCPIRLFKATRQAEKLSAHYLHRDTRNRIQMIPHDPKLGRVARSDLVTAYQLEDQYVVLNDLDLAEIKAPSDKTLLIESFVAAKDVDPIYLDQPFFMVSDGPVAHETFEVLSAAMTARRKVALARIVINRRERLAMVNVRAKGFILTTLRGADEVRDPNDFFSDLPSGDPSTEVQNLAEQLIAMRSGRFDPHIFNDRYQAALKELIEQKVIYGETADQPIDIKSMEAANDEGVREPANVAEAFRQSVDHHQKPPARSRSKPKAKAGRPLDQYGKIAEKSSSS